MPETFLCCESGEKISIDVSQVSNDVMTVNCPIIENEKLFSSDIEFSSNFLFCFAFWISGCKKFLAGLKSLQGNHKKNSLNSPRIF